MLVTIVHQRWIPKLKLVILLIKNSIFVLFFSEVFGDVCFGDWRWPVGCRYCDYKISWNYLDDTDEIEFSIETRAPSNWWTGVGFSSTGTMVCVNTYIYTNILQKEADMIIVKSRSSELTLHDMYSNGYGAPTEDREQNVYTVNEYCSY
jgi:hypothetical protein